MNINIISTILNSPPGHLIKVDSNPHGTRKKDGSEITLMTPEQFPPNPNPWSNQAPSDLSFHLLPDKPRVFSPVIGWVGYWHSNAIMRPNDVIWDFGGILGLLGPKSEFYSGTMYFFPGTRTISLTIRDNQGRSTIVSRQIEITAGSLIYFYWLALFLLVLLGYFTVRKLLRKK
jgi:hypothetical protein